MREKIKEMVKWLGHATFRIKTPEGKVIYTDPYQIKGEPEKADLILVTHEHFDHFSPGDIDKIKKPQTLAMGPKSLKDKTGMDFRPLKPGETAEFGETKIETVPAYNMDKQFHPRENGNLGFVLTVGEIRIYYAGDTDRIPEMKTVKADAALLPIGGTYTMDIEEALEAVKDVKPSIVIPMHYGTVAGNPGDGERFRETCDFCEVLVLTPEK